MTGTLILASGSASRQNMLRQCGLEFAVKPAAIDEAALLAGLEQKLPAEDIARELAEQKALAVSRQNPDACVIGGDQILYFDGKIFSKAQSRDEARAKLLTLRGKTHQLISSVAVARAGKILWGATDSARLSMCAFDEAFIDRYLEAEGDALLSSVGCYMLEGQGAWLFEKIEGSYFTILGMPLLPLLGFLQSEGWGP